MHHSVNYLCTRVCFPTAVVCVLFRVSSGELIIHCGDGCLNITSIKDITNNKRINIGVVSSLLAQRLPFVSRNSRDLGEWGKTGSGGDTEDSK